jgi:hypothetical protein
MRHSFGEGHKNREDLIDFVKKLLKEQEGSLKQENEPGTAPFTCAIIMIVHPGPYEVRIVKYHLSRTFRN